MKKVVFQLTLLLFLLAVLPSLAQVDYLAQARLYLEKQNLKKAKESIDKALEQPETALYADAWYYKGLICEALYQQQRKISAHARHRYFSEALDAYRRVDQSKDMGDTYRRTTQQRIDLFFRELVNEGIEEYRKQTFSNAVDLFDKATQIRPFDTTTLAYAQSAALFAQDYAKAGGYMSRLLEAGYDNVKVYENYVYVLSRDATAGQVDAETVKAVRRRYPQNYNLLSYETNLLIRTGHISEAINNMQMLISYDRSNPKLHLNLGLLHELSGDLESAEQNYLKVIELDSLNQDGFYSLGAYYYNMAIKKNMAAAENPDNTDLLKKSLPYLEKAIQLNPANANTQLALCNVYSRLGMREQAKGCK